ncbi:MAG: hypothetical protein DLM58_07495 [Pseudonocardiales bacterium]|nr:MAG: hypothetical protein DLM58_07495 [Pseudonocardiales bacterium]
MSDETYWLTAVAAGQWQAARELGAGYTWFWCDLTGQHLHMELPDQPPIATHLWGWRSDGWMRWRLDGAEVIGAALHTNRPSGAAVEVRPRLIRGRSWQPGDGRAMITADIVGAVQIREVFVPVSLSFAQIVPVGEVR